MATDPKITARVPTPAALELIRQSEGLRLRAYVCPAGKWTIGYGHTRGVRPGDVITAAEAEALLVEDAVEALAGIDRLVKVPITDGIASALLSFVFNFGETKFAGSTLLRLLNAGDYAGARAQLALWVNGVNQRTGRKEKLPGLVERRRKEAELWQQEPV